MPLTASLHIETALRRGKTVLKTSFCTQPFKLATIRESKEQKALHLVLMSSSPGLLDGDVYDIWIDVGEGCQLQLETQAYQRIFQMRKGASQAMRVNIAKEGFFHYLPHPLVPHRDAIFAAQTKIFLAKGSSLLWGEVISCGRKLNNEIFAFTSYHSLTEIYLQKKLVVKENLLLKPAEMNLMGIGQLEGFTHQATLIYIAAETEIPSLIEQLHEALTDQQQIVFGLSVLPINGLIVRLLGNKAEALYQLLKQLALLIQCKQNTEPKMPKAYVV